MRHKRIEDRVTGIVLELGVGDGMEASIAWYDEKQPRTLNSEPNRTCWVESPALTLGRWVPTRTEESESDVPPPAVVCRATALAVGSWIKDSVLSSLEGLP